MYCSENMQQAEKKRPHNFMSQAMTRENNHFIAVDLWVENLRTRNYSYP